MTKMFHLLLYVSLAVFDVIYCNRVNYHVKRHRVQHSEDIDAPMMVSNDEDKVSETASTDLPYCFSWEPCQFVFTKKNPKDNMPVKKAIPSWCRCDSTQKCVLVEYDRRKKMDVYKCQDMDQPMNVNVRHMRSRGLGGGQEWIFRMPVYSDRMNSEESNQS